MDEMDKNKVESATEPVAEPIEFEVEIKEEKTEPENDEYEYEREAGVAKGCSSMNWGIAGMIVSIVIYVTIVIGSMAMAASYRYSGPNPVFAFVFLGINTFFLIMSISKLVSGVRAMHYSPKVKAILGVAFNGQNVVIFGIYFILALALFFASVA